jgi:hypothetical protein
MSSPGDLQAGPGFFTLRSVRPSEVDDGDSYVFVDPDSPSLTVGDTSARTIDKARRKSGQKLVTAVWTWGLLLVFVVCLTVLPFVSVALFGTNFSPQPGRCPIVIRLTTPVVPIASFFALPILFVIAGGEPPSQHGCRCGIC